MEVKLTVDGEQFAESLEGLLEKLSPEQAQELTLQVIKHFLGVDPEYSLMKAEMVERAKKNYSYGGRDKETYDISREDREKLKKFRSSRQKLIESITEASMSHTLEQVKDWVQKDKFLKEVFEGVKEEIVKEFPSMVMTSIISWFARNMDEMRNTVQATYGMYDVGERLNNIVGKLQQRYLSTGQSILDGGD